MSTLAATCTASKTRRTSHTTKGCRVTMLPCGTVCRPLCHTVCHEQITRIMLLYAIGAAQSGAVTTKVTTAEPSYTPLRAKYNSSKQHVQFTFASKPPSRHATPRHDRSARSGSVDATQRSRQSISHPQLRLAALLRQQSVLF